MKRFILGGISRRGADRLSDTAQEFRLNWGHYLNNSPYVQIEKDFAAAVEKRSNGRVAFNIVYSSGLGKGDELLPLAGRGGETSRRSCRAIMPTSSFTRRRCRSPVFRSPAEAIKIANYSYENIPASPRNCHVWEFGACSTSRSARITSRAKPTTASPDRMNGKRSDIRYDIPK